MTQYKHFAKCYDGFLEREAKKTWRAGILREVNTLGIHNGRVLDLGSGTGIGARLLRQIGDYHLTSLDNNRQMLELSKEFGDRFVLTDMARFNFDDETFDLIVSGFESMNHLSPSQLLRTLVAVSRHLSKKGAFIFDYASPHFLHVSHAKKEYEQHTKGHCLKWKHYYDLSKKRTVTTVSFFENGNNTPLWNEVHFQYALNLEDMRQVCYRAGLQILSVRNLDGGKFSATHRSHVFTTKLCED